MDHVIRRKALLVPVLALLFSFATVGTAQASCAERPPLARAIADAEAVFIGTAVHLDWDGRVATFQVDEIWKGSVEGTAVVNGAGVGMAELETAKAEGQDLFTSVDRTYEQGALYFVVAYGRDAGALLDSGCSYTQTYVPSLAEFRPDSAHPPVGGGDAPGQPADADLDLVAVLAGAALLAGGLVLGVYLVRRRRRSGPAAV